MYVTAATAGKLLIIDPATSKISGECSIKGNPSGVAVAPDGTVFVTGGGVDGKLFKVSAAGKVLDKVSTGHTAMAPVVGKDGLVFVLNRFNNNVVAVDTAKMKVVATIPVLREPHAAVLGAGGKLLFVANHLPYCRATDDVVAASVSVIDTATFKVVKNVMLPNGSTGVRGIGQAIAPPREDEATLVGHLRCESQGRHRDEDRFGRAAELRPLLQGKRREPPIPPDHPNSALFQTEGPPRSATCSRPSVCSIRTPPSGVL